MNISKVSIGAASNRPCIFSNCALLAFVLTMLTFANPHLSHAAEGRAIKAKKSTTTANSHGTKEIVVKFRYKDSHALGLRGTEIRSELDRVTRAIADAYGIRLRGKKIQQQYNSAYPRLLKAALRQQKSELEIRSERRLRRFEEKGFRTDSLEELSDIGYFRTLIIKLHRTESADDVVTRLRSQAPTANLDFVVEAVYANDVISFSSFPASAPDDPAYDNIGIDGNQENSLGYLNIEPAWQTSIGNSSVVVAVVDTGIDITHPDLAANIWTNPGEIPGNLIDDDQNGFVDDVNGYDFVDGNSDCGGSHTHPITGIITTEECDDKDSNPFDFVGHGTQVAGLIAAVTNNGTAMAGTCPECKLLPVRAGYNSQSSNSGVTTAALMLEGIEYAIDMGVDVLNISLSTSNNSVYYDVMRDAEANGIVVVAAAGNEGTSAKRYPAAYPTVLGVAGLTDDIDQNGELDLWSMSNTGTWVDVAAPASKIISTLPMFRGGIILQTALPSYNSGTSFSTALASGVVGLLLSHHPQFHPYHIRQILRQTVSPITAIEPQFYPGFGAIDAGAALSHSGFSDFDQDGIDDGIDNCLLKPNTDQLDGDGDGYGNLCDPDLNQDGFGDDSDHQWFMYCQAVGVNGHQFCAGADINNDGQVTIDDEFMVLNLLFTDTIHFSGVLGTSAFSNNGFGYMGGDGDGWVDEVDNCPFDKNPTQADSDQDGIGDVCDLN